MFDDRPFFFARQKPWGLPRSMMVASCRCLAAAARHLRGAAAGRPARRTRPGPPTGRRSLYFACLGVGFIVGGAGAAAEHDAAARAIRSSRLRCCCSRCWRREAWAASFSARFRTPVVCGVIAAAGCFYALVLPRLVPALLPLSLWARILIAVVIVAPLGFVMGMPFP